MAQFIEKYRGFTVRWEPEGFYTDAMGSRAYGWADTLDELHAEIDDDCGYGEVQLDTPSIDDSAHRYEMNG